MNSYTSYAVKEMNLINVPKNIQSIVCELLDEIDKEGHSGGSMGVFNGMVGWWLKNVDENEEFRDDSLLKPLFTIIKNNDALISMENWTWEQIISMMKKVMMFTPLSPLTGEDDEWMVIGNNTSQNKRYSSVFKEHGKTYWIDGRVFGTPFENGLDWHTWIGSESRVKITFPFVKPDAPEYVYYTDESRQELLPFDIIPDTYLSLIRNKFLRCRNYMTDEICEPYLFTSKNAQEEIAFLNLAIMSLFFGQHGKYNREWVINNAAYYRDETNVNVIDYYYTENLKGEINGLSLTSFQFNTLARLVLLLTDDSTFDEHSKYFTAKGKSYYLFPFVVKKPTKNYQGWKSTNRFMIDWRQSNAVNYEDVYYDGLRLVYNEGDYLFQKRRELGLAHPKRKLNRSLNDQLKFNEDNPINVIKTPIE